MKTLQEIKEEVAKENGFSSWDGASYEEESFMTNTVAKKYAEEVALDFRRWCDENEYANSAALGRSLTESELYTYYSENIFPNK